MISLIPPNETEIIDKLTHIRSSYEISDDKESKKWLDLIADTLGSIFPNPPEKGQWEIKFWQVNVMCVLTSTPVDEFVKNHNVVLCG